MSELYALTVPDNLSATACAHLHDRLRSEYPDKQIIVLQGGATIRRVDWVDTPPGTHAIVIADDLFRLMVEAWNDGPVAIDWGQPDDQGLYTPTVLDRALFKKASR